MNDEPLNPFTAEEYLRLQEEMNIAAADNIASAIRIQYDSFKLEGFKRRECLLFTLLIIYFQLKVNSRRGGYID